MSTLETEPLRINNRHAHNNNKQTHTLPLCTFEDCENFGEFPHGTSTPRTDLMLQLEAAFFAGNFLDD